MSGADFKMTKEEAIQAVLSQAEAALSWDDFLAQVLARWPSQAKNPAAAIRTALRYDRGRRVVLLDKDTLLPVRLVLNGLQFRLPLTREEAERGAVRLIPWLVPFPYGWEHFTQRTDPGLQLLDEADQRMETRLASLHLPVENWRGEREDQPVLALELASWLPAYRPQAGDSLLVTVLDAERHEYRLAFEPARERRADVIAQQNQRLTRALYALISQHREERPYAREILVYAYARLGAAAQAYPGDHWSQIIAADPRLGHIGYQQLGLARYVSLQAEPVLLAEAPSGAGQQVYRFKAAFKHRPGLWRRIEIQGRNTLGEFDRILRQAFGHDPDHLSEFFLKPPDRGRQARWEGYGAHSAWEARPADAITVAELPLRVGDRLNYVYDFGDWVEHLVTLEEVSAAQPERTYPRLSEQSKPRYRYCVACREQGRKTRAVWDCIDCSNREQRDIWLCEDCMDRAHRDHYVVEILY